ncbi:MAG: hypothetical protein ABJC26_11010, partial [Gemmatimonadaceae bacterium]
PLAQTTESFTACTANNVAVAPVICVVTRGAGTKTVVVVVVVCVLHDGCKHKNNSAVNDRKRITVF